ncbi:MAG: hypothetical protein ACXVJ7_18825 [Acidimicrobiia bacterium]
MKASAKLIRFGAIAAIGTVGTLVPLATAGAADYPSGGGGPQVNPNTQTQTHVSPASATRASTLPFTGTDVAELAAIGGVSVGVGVVLVRRSRRVRTTG